MDRQTNRHTGRRKTIPVWLSMADVQLIDVCDNADGAVMMTECMRVHLVHLMDV